MNTTSKAGRREWIGLAVIALPCAVYSMDLTVLNLALPRLSEDLEPSSSQLLWIVDIYGFLVAGLLITMGTLGDRIGRRRLLLIGAAAFGIASVLAALSTSAEMLIAARALLGVAGATLAPSTLALIRNIFADPKQRTFAIGVWITSFSAGAAIGPLIGGLMLESFSWGSVFLLAVPVMALLLVLGPRLLPEFSDPDAGRLDLTSAAASLVAVLAVIFGLKQIAQDGVTWIAVAAIVGGLAAGGGFVRRQGRLADPLIDLRLFRLPAFSGALAANTLGFFVNFGIAVFLAQYLQLVLGLSPLEAGLWTMPWAAGFIVGSMLTPMIVSRISSASAITGGLVLAGSGFALLTQVSGDDSLRDAGRRIRRPRPRTRPGLHPGDRPDGERRPAGAGRRGRGDLGDQLRVRRCTRDRRPWRCRHCAVSGRGRRRGPGGTAIRGRRRRARLSWRRGRGGA